jgi:hypothetical protein
MAKRVQVTFDAADPHRLAAWWSELLGYEVEDVHDRVAALLERGILSEADVVQVDGRLSFAEAVAANDPEAAGPRMLFQRVPESKTAKNRVHLDVPVGNEPLDDAVARVVARGAALVEFGQYPGHRWAVMHDPEGNEFCLQ